MSHSLKGTDGLVKTVFKQSDGTTVRTSCTTKVGEKLVNWVKWAQDCLPTEAKQGGAWLVPG